MSESLFFILEIGTSNWASHINEREPTANRHGTDFDSSYAVADKKKPQGLGYQVPALVTNRWWNAFCPMAFGECLDFITAYHHASH